MSKTNVTALLERVNKDLQIALSALQKSYGKDGEIEVVADGNIIEKLDDTLLLFKQEVGEITYK